MARVSKSSLLQGISGKIGGLVVRQVGNETIVSAAEEPGKRAPRSARQQAHLTRFHQAQRYAAAQMQDADAKALYATGIDARHQSAYHVAIADFMHGPQILAVDHSAYHGRPGDVIRVVATDNFAVTAALIRLETAGGELLEEGPAAPPAAGSAWQYTLRFAGTAARLQVQALDQPGNVTTQELSF